MLKLFFALYFIVVSDLANTDIHPDYTPHDDCPLCFIRCALQADNDSGQLAPQLTIKEKTPTQLAKDIPPEIDQDFSPFFLHNTITTTGPPLAA